MAFHLDNISYDYGDKQAIDRISLTLKPGIFYGIIGPNGCGKTTLVDLLMGLKAPSSGVATYLGKDLREYSKKELAMTFALVPQDFHINFPYTAREIVMMGRYPNMPRFSPPSPVDLALVERVLKKTDTYELRDRFINELSGGERQRVVFARALAQDTAFLFLDEATSNLDINHTLSLLNIARQGVKQDHKTVISVLQDINLAAMYCDRLIVMNKGRIAAEGDLNAILTPETIKSVFRVDVKIYDDSFSGSKQVVLRK